MINDYQSEDRQVFDLIWHQGLTQAETATRLNLHRVLGGNLPGS